MELFGTICLSDIPRELIRTSEKNGKKYLTVIVGERRTPSQYGHTHYLKAYAKRGEVAENTNLFIGDFKVSQYSGDAPNVTQEPQQAPATNNELPF